MLPASPDVCDLAKRIIVVLPMRITRWGIVPSDLLPRDIAVESELQVVGRSGVELGVDKERHPLQLERLFREGVRIEAILEGDKGGLREREAGGKKDERPPGAAEEGAHLFVTIGGGSGKFIKTSGITFFAVSWRLRVARITGFGGLLKRPETGAVVGGLRRRDGTYHYNDEYQE